jgi:hypothetical protein
MNSRLQTADRHLSNKNLLTKENVQAARYHYKKRPSRGRHGVKF